MEIVDRIRAFIGSNFYVRDGFRLDDQMSLLDQGIIDSTGVLDVIQFVEREFAVEVEDHEVRPENLDSIQRIADFVARKLHRRAS